MTNQRPELAFLGAGWAFPVCLDGDEPGLAQYENDVREAILIILSTNYGERVMRPDFGAGLSNFVFEPASTQTMQRIKKRVTDELTNWEARIDVLSVDVEVSGDTANCLLITLRYRVRATNAQFNLVYPFYLEEGAAR
jgi:phage baseplate assembly protein W